MADAHGKRSLKWTPDWPVSIVCARSANDNLRTPGPSANTTRIMLGCAGALAALLVAFHSTFGF